MHDAEKIILLVGIGLVAFFATQQAQSAIDYNSQPSNNPADQPQIDQTNTTMANYTLDQKIAAMLQTIAQFESGGDYGILYGGGHFSDYSQFPNIRVPFYNPLKSGTPGTPNDYSTAAGAYQINFATWQEFGYGLYDFSPASQDIAAQRILQKTGAVDKLANDDIAGAFAAASKRWASLPGSQAQQNPKTLSVALDTYNSNIGALA